MFTRVMLWRSVRRLIAICSILLFITAAQAVTFKNPPIVPSTSDVVDLGAADLNHDGKLDLLYVDGYASTTLHVLLGNGDGTFTHAQDISLPQGVCCDIAIADVTNDGNVDIIMAGTVVNSFIVQIAVMVGNGDGTFQSPVISSFQETSSGSFPSFQGVIAVGDINGDGAQDLVINDFGVLCLLSGNNSGTFKLTNTITTYLEKSVYLADLNGDHNLEIIVTDLLGSDFMVLLGEGHGLFQTGVRYTASGSTGGFRLVDVDGDGHLDMLAQSYPGQIGYFKGNPDGTFGAFVVLRTFDVSNTLAGAADFNSDGILDLLFTNPTGIGVGLGKSGLTFYPIQSTVSGKGPTNYPLPPTPVTGDFNGDGHLDVVMAVEGGIAILLGKGDGTFASADFYDMGQQVGAAVVADFNGDKLPDIAVTVPAVFPRLVIGDGHGGFTLAPDQNSSYGSQTPDTTIVAADFNGDGKVDLGFGTLMPNVSLLGSQSIAFGVGDGTFTTPTVVDNASPVMADFNKDGRADMILVGGIFAAVLLGEANDTFTQITTTLHLSCNQFGVGDLNNDGKPDLILNCSDHFEIWLGNGDGSFSYSSSIDNSGLGNHPILAVTDVDADGNIDLVMGPIASVAVPLGPLTIFYGNGDGTFQTPVFVPISHRYSQLVVADVNRDNNLDLVLTDGDGIAVMMSLGGRKFDSETYYVAGQSVASLNVADVNGDGYPDIVVANPGGTTVVVLVNQPNGQSPQGSPVNGNLTISPEPSVGAQPFTISLTVSGISGGPVPTGSVSFGIDGAFAATVPLANGTASYTVTTTLIPIQHTITATYNGDTTYAPKSFAGLHVIEPPSYSTQTTLVAVPSSPLASQTVRLTATVTSAPPVPSGVVTFLDGANTIGATDVDKNGQALHDTALLAIGTHNLSATYQGYVQPGFTGCCFYTAAIFAPSTSPMVMLNVNANVTTTSLTPSSSSPPAGTVVTFTAGVGSPAGVPFGGVTFYDGTSVLGALGLRADGTAAFSTASLSPGSHTITAAFAANGPFAGSTSPLVTMSVLAAPIAARRTLVSLASETSVTNGSTLVANVSCEEGSPTGRVVFIDNGTIVGAAETNPSGTAILPVGALPSGVHSFTASFGGNAEFAASVSPELYDEWPATGPGFGLSLGARAVQVTPAGSDSLQISIEPLPNFGQLVTLSCSAGLPDGDVCDFTPGTLTGGGVSTLTIRPQTKIAKRSSRSISLYAILCGIVSILLLCGQRRSRALVVLLVCCALGAATGCGTASARTRMVVLTIRAVSGTGSSAIVRSAQTVLIIRDLN